MEPEAGGARILVVDDDHTVRSLIRIRLEDSGYLVSEAANGRLALDGLGQFKPDLIILDLMMPTLDGYATLEHLRQEHTFAALPVIVLSAKSARDDVIMALRVGANDYALKPIDFGLLMQRVSVHLSLKAAAERRVGSYELKKQIGAGGMGIVYEAYDHKAGRPLALKILPRGQALNPELVGRFLREGQLAFQVEHPNVVRVYDVGKEGDTYFLAMELVEGANLAEERARRTFTADESLRITRQVAEGLAALHAHGVVHRDVKPDNVILGAAGAAKLTDLGVARELGTGTRLTGSGLGIGSIVFASLEQIYGEEDHRADIYALGCTLYFMLTGQPPFPATSNLADMVDRKRRAPPRVPELAAPAARVLRKMMQARAARRYQTCVELIAALDEALSPAPRTFWQRLMKR